MTKSKETTTQHAFACILHENRSAAAALVQSMTGADVAAEDVAAIVATADFNRHYGVVAGDGRIGDMEIRLADGRVTEAGTPFRRVALELKDEPGARAEPNQIGRYLEACARRGDTVLAYVRADESAELSETELADPRYLRSLGRPNFTWSADVLPVLERFGKQPTIVSAYAEWLRLCGDKYLLEHAIKDLESASSSFNTRCDLTAFERVVRASVVFRATADEVGSIWTLAFLQTCPSSLRAHLLPANRGDSHHGSRWSLPPEAPARRVFVGCGRALPAVWLTEGREDELTDVPVAWVGFGIAPDAAPAVREVIGRGRERALLLVNPRSGMTVNDQRVGLAGIFWPLRHHHPNAAQLHLLSTKIADGLRALGDRAGLGWLT